LNFILINGLFTHFLWRGSHYLMSQLQIKKKLLDGY
jgi:hypothetical protein